MAAGDGQGWESFGLRLWHGVPARMPRPHQHDEIELNVITSGALTYEFGGEPRALTAGTVAAFWGVRPHRVLDVLPDTTCAWLTVPLPVFLRFGLPAPFTTALLGGQPVMSRAAFHAARTRFGGWSADLPGLPERVLELELEALLRRLAATPDADVRVAPAHHTDRAASLARVIAQAYTQPVTAADLAARAHLNANYAATLHRRVFGQTITQALTRHRLAHAQRLLLTTTQPVAAVAFDSGFQSLSRFYVAFRAQARQTPETYRARRAAPP